MRASAAFEHPPASLISAPALQRRGALPPRWLPPGPCCEETAAPSLCWPRRRPSLLPLIPLPPSQAHRPSAHIPTNTLLQRCSRDENSLGDGAAGPFHSVFVSALRHKHSSSLDTFGR